MSCEEHVIEANCCIRKKCPGSTSINLKMSKNEGCQMMKLMQKVIKYRRFRQCHNHKTNLSIKYDMSMPSICFFKLKSLKEKHQKMLHALKSSIENWLPRAVLGHSQKISGFLIKKLWQACFCIRNALILVDKKPLYNNATRIAFRGKHAFCMGSRSALFMSCTHTF